MTDHCIEWARDQFELLFSKLGKKLELAVRDFGAFEAEQVCVCGCFLWVLGLG